MMKKIMILGGSRYILPVIKTAHRLGIYVITCDYLPDNIAHKYSDEYCNVSVMDKEVVLEQAEKRHIDGIMSFACDPGVVTAAYVAEKMNLPFQGSYKAVSILQDKGLFRKFLLDNDFRCPCAKRYEDEDEPFRDINNFNWPVIVKPSDSAGSKGVTRVDSPTGLQEAVRAALNSAHNGAFIIEDFLTFEGYHSSADVFTVDGKVKFITYSDQLFDMEAENPYTPALIIWPTTMKEKYQNILTDEIQRLMKLLDMRTGIYNIETCVGSDGTPYIMEVSPRGGGCRIAEIQQMAYGSELIENEVRSAIRMPLRELKKDSCDGVWCEMVVHAEKERSGILESIDIDSSIMNKYVRKIDLSVKKGDKVFPFTGANATLGDIFLKFESRKQLDDVMAKRKEWLQIKINGERGAE